MPESVESRARRSAVGFTLVELLTVVAIMAILMTMLAPTFNSAIQMTRRSGCMNNIHSVIAGVVSFAHADSKERLPTVRPKPTEWGNMREGNPGCLARLIDSKHCQRELFLCPEARSTRGFREMDIDGNTFSYDSTMAVSTLSYSFISMVYDAQWKTPTTPEGNLAAKMTLSQAPGTLPILADQNPRCIFGTQTLKSYADIDAASGNRLGINRRRNSPNHGNIGQNVGRLDQSVKWITDPNNPNMPEDDIYTSGSAQEALGRRSAMEDAFLIP